MKLRHKETGSIGHSNSFNVHSVGEIIVYFDEGDASSEYVGDYDVWLLRRCEWKDVRQAFKDHDVAIDDYDAKFYEPNCEEEKVRGLIL